MKLTFYGGAMSVTGANYLLDVPMPNLNRSLTPAPLAGSPKGTSSTRGMPKAGTMSASGRKLLIDCGLFQGSKYAEELNYADFGYKPAEIDFIFITHSHADHVGRLPKLYKEGFRGKIYATEPTKDLIARALPDNWRLIAEEAKADGHEPLYQIEDIEAILAMIETVPYHEKIKISDQTSAELFNAGHILGSAIIRFEHKGRKIYFTGDLGNSPSLLLPDKEFASDADYAVVESAYGSRVHEGAEEKSKILAEVIRHIAEKKGTLMIPSFAVEKTQEILFEINKLLQSKEIPQMPVFMDSPLAVKMTEVYVKHKNYLNKDAQNFISRGKNIFDFPGLRHTVTTEDSKSINDIPPPKIIIAGSGMSNGGRILHHERRHLSDPNSAIVFVGYQVEGSLGRRILDGASEVKIFGENVPVKCLVKGIGGYSAHADQLALVEWARKAFEGNPSTSSERSNLRKVFVVQGEESSANALAEVIKSRVRVNAVVPKPGEEFDL